MKAKFEKYAHWELYLALFSPLVVTLLFVKLSNNNLNQLSTSSVLIFIGLLIAPLVIAFITSKKPRKTLTLQIADGMFTVNDGKSNIIEESEKDIELVLEKITYNTENVGKGMVELRFMNIKKSTIVLAIGVDYTLHYGWKPDIRPEKKDGTFGKYEISKEEALKIIRYYGIHSPIV